MTKRGGDLHQHDADAGETRWHEDDVWCAEFARPEKHTGLKTRTPALQHLGSLENQSVHQSSFFFYVSH